MQKIVLVLVVALLFGCQSEQKKSTEPQKFTLNKGVNVSHWLSQSDKRGEERATYIQKADFDTIAAAGFDHVRICVDEEQLWDSIGNRNPEAFQLLNNALNWALEADLNAIVDLHVIRSHHFNSKENTLWSDPEAQERLYQMWRELSAELNEYPNSRVAYELMNEAVADDSEDWNRLINNMIGDIRQLEPERVIVVGSNRWQKAEYFPQLRLPENDTNIILSFHFYDPFTITHHGVWWMELGKYDGEVNYPGQIVDPENYKDASETLKKEMEWANGYFTIDTLEKIMMPAITFSKEKNLQLYCGEYGVYPSIPEEVALNWYRDMTTLFNKYGIARSHWCYKGDFPIVDYENGGLKTELVEVINR